MESMIELMTIDEQSNSYTNDDHEVAMQEMRRLNFDWMNQLITQSIEKRIGQWVNKNNGYYT